MHTSNSTVRIDLTPEQQEQLLYTTGVNKSDVTLGRLQLAALTLAAAAAGRDALPIAASEGTIRQILHPDQTPAGQPQPHTVRVALTPDQMRQIQELTHRTITAFLFAPDDFKVTYHEDWVPHAAPFRVGRSLVVVPDGQTYEAPDGDHLIRLPGIDGKGVFGTGHHNATQLILALMERHTRPGDRVLDVGTGSAILAVAAARLGAREVLAVDIDPESIPVAQQTVALNGLEGVVRVALGSLEAADGEFDLVLMNLFANVIIPLAPQLPRVVRPGSRVLVCGVIGTRADDVSRAVCRQGFRHDEQHAGGVWAGQVYRYRPGTSPSNQLDAASRGSATSSMSAGAASKPARVPTI